MSEARSPDLQLLISSTPGYDTTKPEIPLLCMNPLESGHGKTDICKNLLLREIMAAK
jgi:hypothetical protein